jgi:signal transduction histidine kinase
VHDLNNPLSVVIGYSALVAEEVRRLAQHDLAGAKKLLEFSAIVEKAADYCHQLSENWRLAARKTTEYSIVDLVPIASEVVQVIFFSNPAIHLSGLSEAKVRGSKFELTPTFHKVAGRNRRMAS